MRILSSAQRYLPLLAFLAITACGGGGGGGGGGSNPPAPSLTFSADKSAVAFVLSEGEPAALQAVTITATGTLPATLFIGAVVEGTGIDSTIIGTLSGNQGVFNLRPRSFLAAGQYTGRVLLAACSDAACTQLLGNSPVAVAYTVDVRPVLKATPRPVTLTAVSGAGASQPVAIQLPFGVATSSVTTPTPGWLTLDNISATGFTVNAASMPSGEHSGQVEVTSGGHTLVVPVTYTVTSPPGGDHSLSASPGNLTFAIVESASAAASLAVTPPSWNPQVASSVEYPAGAASGWLGTTAVAGGLTVTANALDLPAGSYTAMLRLTAAYPSSSVTIPVALTVGVGLVRPADVVIGLNAETPAAAFSAAVPVNVAAGPAASWTATSNAAWLAVTPSGQTGGTLTYTLDPSALTNGAAHTATVVITPTRATMSPVSFTVTVDKRLPEITSVGPYVHLAGAPLRVILRGSGFDAVAALHTRLSLQGGTITTIEEVNDTEVMVEANALSVGVHEIAVSNASGLPAPHSAVTVVAPQVFSAASLPTDGVLRSLTFDAERGAVYAANTTLGSIMTFTASGANWDVTSVPFADAYDVGLSNDGKKLIAASNALDPPTTGTGSIRLLDPVTLDTLSTTQLPGGLEPTFTNRGFGIHTTNDGRSWFAVGRQLAFTTTFRAATLEVAKVLPPFQTELFGGPWFAVSRDGERLIVVQSSTDPMYPMLYMDAADAVLKKTPTNLFRSLVLGVNEDGSRVLLQQFDIEVRDADFNLVGRALLPTGPLGHPLYNVLSAQISVDGGRIYVLAYPVGSGANPRVLVYDSSAPPVGTDELPVLGLFELPAYPTCTPAPSCDSSWVASAISLDSATLFYGGNERLLVVPIPAVLTPL
jgi:hypothetical protein